jgi:hypothetical protein
LASRRARVRASVSVPTWWGSLGYKPYNHRVTDLHPRSRGSKDRSVARSGSPVSKEPRLACETLFSMDPPLISRITVTSAFHTT